MAQNKSRRLLWAVCLAALAAFAAAMVWLHYQQLCSPGGGSDPYTSDLGMHLAFAQRGMIYSTVSLLIGPAYALAGRVGIAVLLAAFHLAAVAVFTVVAALIALLVLSATANNTAAIAAGVCLEAALLACYLWKPAALTSAVSAVLGVFSAFDRLSAFTQNGLFDMTALFYYLSGAGLFCFLSAQSLEKRRWN